MAGNDIPITIVGNLCDDPDYRITPNGVGIAKFTVALTPRVFDKTSNGYRDGDTTFLTCTAWRQVAEHVAESLSRGTRVVVTGRLRQHRWETPEGDKRSAFGLDVEEVGASLRFANVRVQKATRTSAPGGDTPPDDPWTSATPAGDGFSDPSADVPF